jgi:hypothetical protein
LASRKPQPRFSSRAPPIDFFIDEVEVAILTTSGGAGLCTKVRNLVQNSSIQGYQDSSISAAFSERRSRLAKIEPSIVTKVVSCFYFQEALL